MAENKSRLSRMRNVRVNAAGLLRRAPSFLPETTSGSVVAGSGGVGLTRSNSSSSTFYVQLPAAAAAAATTERKPVVAYLPVISSPSPLWQQRHEQTDSETSGCESGRLTR